MHIAADRIESAAAVVDADKRVPFGWHAAAVQAEPYEAMRLSWSGSRTRALPAPVIRFRLTVAVDVREEKLVELRSLQTSSWLGIVDVRYAPVFQIFEVVLSGEDAELAWCEGIGMRLAKGSSPLWIFVPGHEGNNPDPVLLPHLWCGTSPEEPRLAAFEQRLNSLASLQQFGWMEGCVLDGLMDYGFRKAAEQHLNLYIRPDGGLVYENPRSMPADGRFYGIESLLPVAILAKLNPEHPLLKQAAQYMNSMKAADGAIRDQSGITAEGNYTIAYTLACLSNGVDQADSKRLAEAAIEQLEARKRQLWVGSDLYLRYHTDHSRTFKHWGRAHVWYLLGLIRTLRELTSTNQLSDEQKQYWREEFIRAWNVAWAYRNEEGCWYSFIHEPDSKVDTSATAGIAAAGAIALRLGYLPDHYDAELWDTLQALLRYLTPDGLAGDASQANKGGEQLQRDGYRVISQVTMGLMAQLISSLNKDF